MTSEHLVLATNTVSPSPSTHYDVMIVGAGPAGSSMAAWLAGQGWRVLLVERDHLPRHKVCGEFLSPEALNTLRAQGLHETVAALDPVPLQGATLTAQSGRTLHVKIPGQAWGISRYALDAALATRAQQQGAALWTGTTVTSWQHVDGGMVVQVRRRGDAALQEHDQPCSVQTRALVMACGRHGSATLLMQHRPRRKDNPARHASVGIKCHFANVVMPAQTELYLFAGGYIGINPVEKGYANVCALASYDTFARAGRSPQALIEAAARWNPAFTARLADAHAMPQTQCSVAPVDSRRGASVWAGLPLLGDTAAMIPPLCGDGMAMALRSAHLCAPLLDAYLRAACSWSGLGESYRRLWHREFDRRLRIGRLLETLLLSPRTTDLLFSVGARIPALADYFVRATRGAG